MMKKVRWKEMATGVVLGTVFMSPWSSLFEVRPYTNVQLVSVAKTDTAVTITANFRKTDCSFQRLEVFGYDLGQTYVLDWENVVVRDEVDRGFNYDRAEGGHTLRIKVKLPDTSYDKIEIRTRHLCDGAKVDKVFITVDSKDLV
jgi:hypothetical protein